MNNSQETIVLAAGCFWCYQGVFQMLNGVISSRAGYAGGEIPNPTYEQICTGATGHAEVVEVVFNPAQISLAELLEVFWTIHDPTTLNRQGNDIGTQYRSAIFYTSDEQKSIAMASLEAAQSELEAQIVTQITPLEKFYAAEDYHQDYFENNPQQPYCQVIISPKIKKFKEKFADKLR